MSDIITKILDWLRGVTSKMGLNSTTLKEMTQSSVVSNDMSQAQKQWLDMYMNKADDSMQLATSIAAEIARLVTLEMGWEVADPNKKKDEPKGTADKKASRAEHLNNIIQLVKPKLRRQVEYACAGGGLIMKPYLISKNGKPHTIAVDFVQATSFIPMSFDGTGCITAGAFVELKQIKDRIYNRLEIHEMKDDGYYITNRAFVALNKNDTGKECPLTEVPEWAEIEPVAKLEAVEKPLFSYFMIPIGNTIDPNSPLGVSVYSRAVELIKDAHEQYQRLLWEFEGGELAIDVSEDAYPKQRGSEDRGLPQGKERLFRVNKLTSDENPGAETFKAWAPQLRDESLLKGLNKILMTIEDTCFIARGTLSDVQQTDKTAEEVKNSKQKSYSTVTDIQKSLQAALNDLVYAIDVYVTLYFKDVPTGEYAVSYKWDDSIVVDSKAERETDRADVRDGFMQKWEYRVKWYGETKEQALAAIKETEEEIDDDDVLGFNKKTE